MPTVKANIETWFAPLLAKLRPLAHKHDDKNKRVKDNYSMYTFYLNNNA